MSIKFTLCRIYRSAAAAFIIALSIAALSCSQNSTPGNQLHSEETLKARVAAALASVTWEKSGFEERQLTGSKKASVNNKDFLAMFPAEKGVYPEYPGIGVLDYTGCTPAISDILAKTGAACTSGTWPAELFVPADRSTAAYYRRITENLPTGTTYIHSQPFFTDTDAFEALFLLESSESEYYLTVYYVFENDQWYIDDIIQDTM